MQYHFEKSGKLKVPTVESSEDSDSDSYIIVCNQGKLDDGRPYWVYIAVRPSKYQELLHATKEHLHINFADYGPVLKYGFSAEVPASIKEEMRQKHNCDELYMKKLKEEINRQRRVFLKKQEDERLNDIVKILKEKKHLH